MPSKSMVDLHQQGELFEPDFGHKVQLPAFEGPLDLLLHLIRKHKVDVYDIHAKGSLMEEALKFAKGKRWVPVLVEGERVTVGFDGH